jgi:hypothetical protein
LGKLKVCDTEKAKSGIIKHWLKCSNGTVEKKTKVKQKKNVTIKMGWELFVSAKARNVPISGTVVLEYKTGAIPSTARKITRRWYTTVFNRSSQRTEWCDGTNPCHMERWSSRTPPCKQGCPEVYPQPSKKISLGTF